MLRLEHKLRASLTELLPEQSELRIGVACSGGPDSVSLLHALRALAPKLRYELTVLHVNHGLRTESEQEQAVVQDLCQQWQLPLHIKKLKPPQGLTGIEAWARNARYAFFHRMRADCSLDYVVTAHTRDDQAETVLFRVLRGSARRGLAGIPPVRDGWLLRPLLKCSRAEVDDYVAAKKLRFVTDPSNTDVRFTRNKIRHLLLPYLEKEFSPQIRRHLATLAETSREEEEWLEGLATAARQRATPYENDENSDAVLSLKQLDKELPALRQRILRQWAEKHTRDLGTAHVLGLKALSEGKVQGQIELPGKKIVVREGARLRIQPNTTNTPSTGLSDYLYALRTGQSRQLEAGWTISVSTPVAWDGEPKAARCTNPWFAVFDCTGTGQEQRLLVRNYRAGDRIQPLGMPGHKKIQDVFVDAHIPQSLRQGFPVIEINGEIVWVPGCVRGNSAVVTNSTQRVYRIQVTYPIEINPLLAD